MRTLSLGGMARVLITLALRYGPDACWTDAACHADDRVPCLAVAGLFLLPMGLFLFALLCGAASLLGDLLRLLDRR